MNRVGAITLGICLLAALALPGCGQKDEDDGPDVLVTVNGQPIKTQDLQIAWNAMPEEQRKSYNSPKGIISLVDELVAFKMMAIEAENQKLDQDPLFKKRIELYRQRLLVNALIERTISESDLMNHFQGNFLHANFIRVRFPENATEAQKTAARSKADTALTRLAAGMEFGEAIEEFSEMDPDENGDLGYVTHQVVENLTSFAGAEELFALKEPGLHTGVIEGKNAYFIFELVEAPGKLDVRGLTPTLANAIREERREQVIRSLANELKTRKDFEVVRNTQHLNELMKILQENWMQITGSPLAEPAPGATAAPAPGGTATPLPGATTAPTAGTTTAPASGDTVSAPGATVPAAGATVPPTPPAGGATAP